MRENTGSAELQASTLTLTKCPFDSAESTAAFRHYFLPTRVRTEASAAASYTHEVLPPLPHYCLVLAKRGYVELVSFVQEAHVLLETHHSAHCQVVQHFQSITGLEKQRFSLIYAI